MYKYLITVLCFLTSSCENITNPSQSFDNALGHTLNLKSIYPFVDYISVGDVFLSGSTLNTYYAYRLKLTPYGGFSEGNASLVEVARDINISSGFGNKTDALNSLTLNGGMENKFQFSSEDVKVKFLDVAQMQNLYTKICLDPTVQSQIDFFENTLFPLKDNKTLMYIIVRTLESDDIHILADKKINLGESALEKETAKIGSDLAKTIDVTDKSVVFAVSTIEMTISDYKATCEILK